MLTIKTLVMFKNGGKFMFKDINNVLVEFVIDPVKVFKKVYKGELKERILKYIKEKQPKKNLKYNVTFINAPTNLESFTAGYIDIMDGYSNKHISRLEFQFGDVLQFKNTTKSNDYYYLHKIFDGDPVQF